MSLPEGTRLRSRPASPPAPSCRRMGVGRYKRSQAGRGGTRRDKPLCGYPDPRHKGHRTSAPGQEVCAGMMADLDLQGRPGHCNTREGSGRHLRSKLQRDRADHDSRRGDKEPHPGSALTATPSLECSRRRGTSSARHPGSRHLPPPFPGDPELERATAWHPTKHPGLLP